MDEFFNFEDAATQLNHETIHQQLNYFDADLAFADLDNDEDSFTCLQHFSAADGQLAIPSNDTAMGPDDFSDFPRWIDGMCIASRPCDYCQKTANHCKIIKEGRREGSCTCCVALGRPCSLSYVEQQKSKDFIDEFPDALADSNAPQASIETDVNLVENLPKNNGTRFSRESLKILKGWLSTHHHHPYPREEEKEQLRRQTGLNKTQITNWLANARRRGKVRAPRSTSPSVRNYSNAIDIPRRGTPALKNMDPLERWKNSPPEHEPASVTAIARAVTSSNFSLDHDSPYTSYGQTDDGSSRSICNVSSTSSLGTSLSSGGSFASAFSHKSRGSFGSFGSFGTRGRRRRRRAPPKAAKITGMISQPARTFQCTFCTETFKTKHDWQRHEKTLHLSLERWVCSPDGPNQYCADYDHLKCVYCGLQNPPKGHEESHNHASCAERSLEERTFYRKDHLRQHLNLVHDVKFQSFSMENWKVATPEIRSRCGFCGIVLGTWSIRVDHLAEHFKGGQSMADWKGDWGFEPQVLDIVENGMPPYLIHDERNSIEPFEGSKDYAESKRTLDDHVKIALVDYLNDSLIQGTIPTDEDLLVEARTALIKAEATLDSHNDADLSWFRDLIKLSGQHDYQGPNGAPRQRGHWGRKHKDNDVQAFALEREALYTVDRSKDRSLRAFVDAQQALGLTPSDTELQAECCRIVDEAELTSIYRSRGAVTWFKYLIKASTEWLSEFRKRAGLPRSSEIMVDHIRNPDECTIDHSVHNPRRLFVELAQFVKKERSRAVTLSDSDLQRQARLIIYKNDDPWNQTAMDNSTNIQYFKRKTGLAPSRTGDPSLPCGLDDVEFEELTAPQPALDTDSRLLHWDMDELRIPDPSLVNNSPGANISGTEMREQPLHKLAQNQPSTNTNPTVPLKYFLNDANCYNRLVKELARFVASCVSVNNPKQHVPTDAEIQNQARWIIYDDDDPWNQTAADNAEWLVRFKRHVGLTPAEAGPGLPVEECSWRVSSGGTGFSPPYLFPRPESNLCGAPRISCGDEPSSGGGKEAAKSSNRFPEDVTVTMKQRRTYTVRREIADHYMRSVPKRYEPPAAVFCARELETGLSSFLSQEVEAGRWPSDEVLKEKAREILGVGEKDWTAAEDEALLRRFKEVYGGVPPISVSSEDSSADRILSGNETGNETGTTSGKIVEPNSDMQIPLVDDALMTGDSFAVPEIDAALLDEWDEQLSAMDFGSGMNVDMDGLDFGVIEGGGHVGLRN